jgi:hypothetical protein
MHNSFEFQQQMRRTRGESLMFRRDWVVSSCSQFISEIIQFLPNIASMRSKTLKCSGFLLKNMPYI